MSIFKISKIDLKNITSFTYSASAGGRSLSIFDGYYIFVKGLKSRGKKAVASAYEK